jgi:microcystin-dependent protein
MTTTPNYGWYIGTIFGDFDVWGQGINSFIYSAASPTSLDTMLYSIQRNNISNTAPSTLPLLSTGSMWLNSTSNPYVLNIYDGTQYVPIGTLNTTAHTFTATSTGFSIGDFKHSMQTSITGWLLCNGAAVSRVTYSALNLLMSQQTPAYPFGSGDGSTTFNLPDLRGQVPAAIGTGTYSGASTRTIGQFVGEEQHTLITSEIPSHSHTPGGGLDNFLVTVTGGANGAGPGTSVSQTPTTGNTGGDGAHNTMQPTLFVGNYFIYSGV